MLIHSRRVPHRLVAGGVILGLGLALFGSSADAVTKKATTTKKKAAATTKGTVATTAAPTTAAAATPTTAAAPTTTKAPAFNFDTGATLRYAWYRSPPTLDAARIPTNTENPVLWLTVDRLVHFDEKLNPVPGLAESWTYSSDGLSMTLKLRQGVKFFDGTAFDAAAAKANLERGRDLPASTVRNDLANIASIETPDASTVVLRLRARDYTLPLVLSNRPGAMISPASFNLANNGQFPVGSGMYKIVTNEPNAWIYFDRNNDYWDKSANPLARIEMTILPDPTARFNALRSNQVDMAYLDPDYLGDAAKISGIKVVKGNDLRYGSIQINPDNVKPYADLRVRQAMNWAIDRQGIVDGILNGNAIATAQPFPTGYFAHDDSVDNFYKQDLDKAKALLKEAGYENGFSFSVMIGGLPPRSILEAVQAQLKKVNIKMDIEQITGNDGVLRMWTQKSAEALTFVASGRPDPAIQLRQYFVKGVPNNVGGLASNIVQAAYEKSLVETDTAARGKLFQQISNDLVKNPAGIIILYNPITGFGMKSKVQGVRSWLSGDLEFRGVGIVK